MEAITINIITSIGFLGAESFNFPNGVVNKISHVWKKSIQNSIHTPYKKSVKSSGFLVGFKTKKPNFVIKSGFLESWQWDSNPQPADYKSAALPIELCQQIKTRKI